MCSPTSSFSLYVWCLVANLRIDPSRVQQGGVITNSQNCTIFRGYLCHPFLSIVFWTSLFLLPLRNGPCFLKWSTASSAKCESTWTSTTRTSSRPTVITNSITSTSSSWSLQTATYRSSWRKSILWGYERILSSPWRKCWCIRFNRESSITIWRSLLDCVLTGSRRTSLWKMAFSNWQTSDYRILSTRRTVWFSFICNG